MTILKEKQLTTYIKIAKEFGKLSYCERLKVGAIAVKDDRIISIGYNGTASGQPNVCELSDGSTNPETIHAEMNMIAKLAKSNESADGAVVFLTVTPCLECAKLMVQSGIRAVYHEGIYRSDAGVEFLKKCGVETIQINNLNNGE